MTMPDMPALSNSKVFGHDTRKEHRNIFSRNLVKLKEAITSWREERKKKKGTEQDREQFSRKIAFMLLFYNVFLGDQKEWSKAMLAKIDQIEKSTSETKAADLVRLCAIDGSRHDDRVGELRDSEDAMFEHRKFLVPYLTSVEGDTGPLAADPFPKSTAPHRLFMDQHAYRLEFEKDTLRQHSFTFFTFFSFIAQHVAFPDLLINDSTSVSDTLLSLPVSRLMRDLEEGFCEMWFRSHWTGADQDCHNYYMKAEDILKSMDSEEPKLIQGFARDLLNLPRQPPERPSEWFVNSKDAQKRPDEYRKFLIASHEYVLWKIAKLQEIVPIIEKKCREGYGDSWKTVWKEAEKFLEKNKGSREENERKSVKECKVENGKESEENLK